MKIGLMVPQSPEDGAATWRDVASLARRAEDAGFDSLWLCDHFFYRDQDGKEVGIHEAWTLLSALAVETRRIELGTLVLATSFRSPGLLAKMAVTADDVAAGRLILGLGCGWYEDEYRAFGFPFDHRVGRFEEALRIIVPLVRGERVTFEGRWERVDDAVVLPAPARPVPVLVAAKGERMLQLTAELADQWQTAWYGLPDDRWTQRRAAFVAACEARGRDLGTVATTVGIEVGERDGLPPGWRPIPLDAGAVADALATWRSEGTDHVQIVAPLERPDTLEALAEGIERFRR